MTQRIVRALVAMVFALLLTACNRQQENRMPDSSRPAIEAMRTICVGRFVFDIPASATRISVGQTFKGVTIDVKHPIDGTQFNALVQQEAAQLPKTTSFDGLDRLPSAATIHVSDDGSGLDTVRGYVLKDSVAYLFSVQVENDSVDGAKVAIQDLMRRIQPRDMFAIPAQAGFCVERGFIPGGFEGAETISFGAEIPELKSEFVLNTDTGNTGSDDNLLARMAKLPTSLAAFVAGSTETLRKDARSVAGRNGDEYGYLVKDSNNVSLNWSALPGRDRAVEPAVETWMHTTSPTSPGERPPMLAMWDTILNSIRFR